MIFKLKFSDKIEFAQSKSDFDLKEQYSKEYGLDSWLKVVLITKITEDEAKEIMIKNTDSSTFHLCSELSIYETSCGDDFCVIASTEWI